LTGVKAFTCLPVESLAARTLRDPEIPVRLGASWVALLHSMTAMDPAARPAAAEAHAKARTLLPRR
jgi:eukaryotic-like serine/threonine-protein kinase